MKTKYSSDYLTRKYGPRGSAEWTTKKRLELSSAWGVPVCSYYAAGSIVFLPVMPKDIEPETDPVALADFETGYNDAMTRRNVRFNKYVSYLRIAELSGLSVRRVMKCAKTYQIRGRASMTVGRTGQNVAVKITEVRK